MHIILYRIIYIYIYIFLLYSLFAISYWPGIATMAFASMGSPNRPAKFRRDSDLELLKLPDVLALEQAPCAGLAGPGGASQGPGSGMGLSLGLANVVGIVVDKCKQAVGNM